MDTEVRSFGSTDPSDDEDQGGMDLVVGRAGAQDVPAPAQDVVTVEGSAEEVAPQIEEGARLRILSFSPEGRPSEAGIETVPGLIKDDVNFVWIDLCGYTPEDLHEIGKFLHLSRAELSTVLSPWQRPRLHVSSDRFFCSVTVPHTDPHQLAVTAGELDLFVGRNYLLSIHKLELPFDGRVLPRVNLNPELPRLDSAYMLYILLDELIEHYEDEANDIDEEIERREQQALVEAEDEFLGDLLKLKRYVYAMNRLVEQHRQVFEAFLRPDFPFISGEEATVYFRDLESRLARLLDNVAAAKESVNGAFDIYVSRVAHQTNHVMKVLTVISAILLPVTVILSFFGTSFQNQSFIYSTAGFVVMVASMLVVTTVLILYFRRRRWF